MVERSPSSLGDAVYQTKIGSDQRPRPAWVGVLASSRIVSRENHVEHLAAAQRGDPVAMRRMLEGLAPMILATTRQILGHREDAEDAAQEAMVDLARGVHDLRQPSALVAFARRLTARVALRHRAKRQRSTDKVRDLASRAPTPAHTTPSLDVAQEQAERLRDHLTRIPTAQAEAVVMQHMLGYRPAEIAAATGVSVNTVRSRIRLGREALARSLAADGAFQTPESEAS